MRQEYIYNYIISIRLHRFFVYKDGNLLWGSFGSKGPPFEINRCANNNAVAKDKTHKSGHLHLMHSLKNHKEYKKYFRVVGIKACKQVTQIIYFYSQLDWSWPIHIFAILTLLSQCMLYKRFGIIFFLKFIYQSVKSNIK